jgi:hypothetical protein
MISGFALGHPGQRRVPHLVICDYLCYQSHKWAAGTRNAILLCPFCVSHRLRIRTENSFKISFSHCYSSETPFCVL